ncbi:ABC transporter substrate-binding protein [Leptolyngbya sp. FACHB-261]|uniref:substrate-binding periplasmic protein n=1 Tax=Leptolyngbya sp. FACHB-261 TaxID=2692806 RepID=UPI0016881541|nr:ABC transporter substrate-binding protein [Leptolyngbya sp. FACHB-261]MBD2102650.1 amino acid ABC transporter substrate-binding protein [Leptolyngbya sp. FACHB-261]
MNLNTVTPGCLTFATCSFDTRPMAYLDGDARLGYEPDIARAVCARLGLKPVWIDMPWADFYPTLAAKQCDAIWFNQAITEDRLARADFTRPYGLFDESVIVKQDSPVHTPQDLAGLRVGALVASTNQRLAESYGDVQIVTFPGSDNVLAEMLDALRAGTIDALVDDELVLVTAEQEDPSLRIAFTEPTRIPYGIAVRKGDAELLEALNYTLESLIAEGTLPQLWAHWIPYKAFPF